MTNIVSEEPVSTLEKASLGYQTLIGLRETGITYCLWKSFDRLAEGIKGETDFDILFDKKQKQEVFNYLRQNGWFEVLSEPWRRFPDVYDFIQYDPQHKKFLHFHVHFKLVMGEKLIKSLSLPLESLYLQTAVEAEGIFHAMPELELCVFILRLSLKISFRDYARIIRRRSRKMIYRDLVPEFLHIRQRCDRTRLETLLKHPALSFIDRDLVLETYEDIYSLNYSRRRRIKSLIAPHRRYGSVARFFVYRYRRFQKKSFGQGKTFPKRGMTFAFCGPDGSGKTTLVDSVEQRLSEHLKVARYYMGGNKTSKGVSRYFFYLLLQTPYLVVRKFFKIIKDPRTVKRLEQLYFSYENYLIAKEKFHRYNLATMDSKQGVLVLFERFPLFRDLNASGDQGVTGDRACFESSEQKFYEQIKTPNILFILQVDSTGAILRKPDHCPDVIRDKTSAFENFINENKNNPKVVVLDGNSSIDIVLETALKRINKELGSDS